MRRNRVEVTAERDGFCVCLREADSGRMLFHIATSSFCRAFGFTPRPGKKIKIVMEIQEEKK